MWRYCAEYKYTIHKNVKGTRYVPEGCHEKAQTLQNIMLVGWIVGRDQMKYQVNIANVYKRLVNL